MSTSDQSDVELEVRNAVAVVTMNRPPVNALGRALLSELRTSLERCARDGNVRVVIIASALAKAFCAGADIPELKRLRPEESEAFAAQGQGLCEYLEAMPKPTIAAVRGLALGGGCELAMACDMRVAGESASFGQPEVNLGLIPGWGGTQRLPRLIARGVALEMMLSGHPVSAQRALALGLVNRVVADDQVLAEASRLAEALVSKPPGALALVKRAVREGLEQPLHKGLRTEMGLFAQARAGPEAEEGLAAFLEKRKPRFGGR